jgi:catalase (peroxidase I)
MTALRFGEGLLGMGFLVCYRSTAGHNEFTTNNSIVADLVALGTVMSNNLCGGAQMPFRAGRVDATEAGKTTGVPAPETDLEETLMLFERAGFDNVDAIGLTACGHTLGSVHHVGVWVSSD